MMTVFKKTLGIIITLFVMISLIACDFDESKNHLLGGQLLDDEKMSEIKNEIISGTLPDIAESENTETDSSSAQIEVVTNEKDTDNEPSYGTVYWTESGSVWHTSRDCRYLKKSTNILSGSVEKAKESGKTRACSGCGK